ncbi:hypothetical protein Afil01_42650 [Actinorhabdospora filicis]|uniref:Uncharacterized protein n=1 Tax=Actinorhabdospora filicis TaxID=1785913 RepID=A0A9W6SNH0_9ACTN|nr:hypothetical protein [Actinorhabdospora filicis]GLZ79458.1 hypothetical protein Afil01_42650 [Actinorhabdospora filicis]
MSAVISYLRGAFHSAVVAGPAASAATYAGYHFWETHWALGILAGLAAVVLLLPFGHALFGVLTGFWPGLDPADTELRAHLKSLTDAELLEAEKETYQRLTTHTPRFGEERCPRCGTRSPTRCSGRLDAERDRFAVHTERRVRDEHARLTARAAKAEQAARSAEQQP